VNAESQEYLVVGFLLCRTASNLEAELKGEDSFRLGFARKW
jgi:hypothetical protein